MGVVVLGVVVTGVISSGGMKGITFVQAFQYWLKLTAIAVPALVLLMVVHHPPLTSIEGTTTPTFHRITKVEFPDAEFVTLATPTTVRVDGAIGGVRHDGVADPRRHGLPSFGTDRPDLSRWIAGSDGHLRGRP